MYKYLVLFHDLYYDTYRAYAQCNTKKSINHYINYYLRNEEEAIVIDTRAGIITEVYEKKDFHFRHMNLLTEHHFLTIEQIGLTWERCKELSTKGYR